MFLQNRYHARKYTFNTPVDGTIYEMYVVYQYGISTIVVKTVLTELADEIDIVKNNLCQSRSHRMYCTSTECTVKISPEVKI